MTKAHSRLGRVFLFALLFLATLLFSIETGLAQVPHPGNIRVVLGQDLLHFSSQQPFITEGKTYVPLREILEKLGDTVNYVDGVIVYRGRHSGTISLNTKTLRSDKGIEQPLDLRVVDGHTMVHTRGLAEILGEKVGWDNPTQTVLINYPFDDITTRIPVLMYHYLVPANLDREPENNAVLPVENFKKQMAYLDEQGYYTATLAELEKFIKGDLILPKKSVVITFDDGYQNNIIYAYPELKKYGFHAVIFPVGSRIQKTPTLFDPAKTSYLSWEEINSSKDVFEFHSHTYDLHHKVTLANGKLRGAALDPKLLKTDIEKMKENIDTPYICYPYGDFDQAMIATLLQAGYRMGFTVHQGFNQVGDNLMLLKRLTVKPAYDIAQYQQLLTENK